MLREGYNSESPKNKQVSASRTRDALFSRLPDSLQERWEDVLDSLTVEEQIQKIEFLLAERSKTKNHYHAPMLLPEGVEFFESFPDDVRESIEMLKTSERTIEIGYGKAGHVIAHPSQKEICYKILFDDEKLPLGTNDISRETELQHEVGDLFDGHFGVLVPKVFAFISEPGTRAIIMELLNAPSLRKVVERKKEQMPEAFDEERFFKALESFIAEMNSRGYYHRDLHGGNVLVHRETGMPCVIDFGLSKETSESGLDCYREKIIEDGHFKEIMLQSDLENLKKLRKQVKEYLAFQKE